MDPIDREALELAATRCVGRYTIDHVKAWESLAERGLVRNVRSAAGAWYEITAKGREFLEWQN